MLMGEKIAILIPAFNAEKYIAQAIESVLEQTYSNFELILINDGSDDRTLAIMEEYGTRDSRIIIDDHENLGKSYSINKAVNDTECYLVAQIDADDIMLPDRIQKQAQFMIDNQQFSLVSCLAFYIDKDGRVLGKTFSDVKTVEDNQRYLKQNEPIGLLSPGVMYVRNDFIKIGGYRKDFWPAEDIDLYSRMIEKSMYVCAMQEVLMKYRIHDSSIINRAFMESRRRLDFGKECMRLRRTGLDEITYERFLEKENQLPIYSKLNKFRKRFAKYLYRKAGFKYSVKNYLFFLVFLVGAFICQPLYVINKLKGQVSW